MRDINHFLFCIKRGRVIAERLPQKRRGSGEKLQTVESVCVCVIILSVPVFACITAIVVQVWTADRSSSVCPPGASNTHASVSRAGQRLTQTMLAGRS